MAYRRITALEADEMIKDGDMMALSGFTPNANPKAIFRELSKRTIRLHEAGEPFQVGILTGASSCQSVEGDMAAAKSYSDKNGKISADLQKDLDAIRDAKIPRDIVYKQGASVLAL